MKNINEALTTFGARLDFWGAYLNAQEALRADEKELPKHLRIAEAGLHTRPDDISDKKSVADLRQQVKDLSTRKAAIEAEYEMPSVSQQVANLRQCQRDVYEAIEDVQGLDEKTVLRFEPLFGDKNDLSKPTTAAIAQAREAVRELRKALAALGR